MTDALLVTSLEGRIYDAHHFHAFGDFLVLIVRMILGERGMHQHAFEHTACDIVEHCVVSPGYTLGR
jgi:hypothetical protein